VGEKRWVSRRIAVAGMVSITVIASEWVDVGDTWYVKVGLNVHAVSDNRDVG
jgi:hypothetical protein